MPTSCYLCNHVILLSLWSTEIGGDEILTEIFSLDYNGYRNDSLVLKQTVISS
ncbi:hypothetical protein KC19_6G014000 [Ceratodon purpureus]|uniref:Uncharacterized protein n=1 Tax=Ceratodon purpureus TaxID=3225 RepID=A0A8T0HAQ6_CERPU|nr:hypothetical protein KC19_6G014000 [Ceratodon purpureus]